MSSVRSAVALHPLHGGRNQTKLKLRKFRTARQSTRKVSLTAPMLDLLTMPETAATLIASAGAIAFVVAWRWWGRD